VQLHSRTLTWNYKKLHSTVASSVCASAAMVWPWTLTFWCKNAIRSCASQVAQVTQVWRKSVNRYWRYRGNMKLPRVNHGRTHGRTHGQRHGRTTRKHIASAGAYRRRRLKNINYKRHLVLAERHYEPYPSAGKVCTARRNLLTTSVGPASADTKRCGHAAWCHKVSIEPQIRHLVR